MKASPREHALPLSLHPLFFGFWASQMTFGRKSGRNQIPMLKLLQSCSKGVETGLAAFLSWWGVVHFIEKIEKSSYKIE